MDRNVVEICVRYSDIFIRCGWNFLKLYKERYKVYKMGDF